jgi:hypothetical protein
MASISVYRFYQLPLLAPVDLTFCLAPPGFELAFINFEPVLVFSWFFPGLLPAFLLFVGNDINKFLSNKNKF